MLFQNLYKHWTHVDQMQILHTVSVQQTKLPFSRRQSIHKRANRHAISGNILPCPTSVDKQYQEYIFAPVTLTR